MGPALDTLERMIEDGEAGTYDMVFVDADKEASDDYYEAALKLLRPGGVVMVDDSLWSGRVVDEDAHNDRESSALRGELTEKNNASLVRPRQNNDAVT